MGLKCPPEKLKQRWVGGKEPTRFEIRLQPETYKKRAPIATPRKEPSSKPWERDRPAVQAGTSPRERVPSKPRQTFQPQPGVDAASWSSGRPGGRRRE